MYKVQLFIDGCWRDSVSGKTIPVINPATEERIGEVAHAQHEDLEITVNAAAKGFKVWRRMSPLDRSKIMRNAADLLRQRIEAIATVMTLEQGKPIAEAKVEVLASADILDWCAEESRRTYGRVIPSRGEGIYNLVLKEPVGPVAAFTPWNFPISQAVRKIGAALSAGCSVVIKPPEETPASPAELIRALADAGVPNGVVNLVYGVPSEISNYLIADPVIRKISFTGSTPVGKQLASLAGMHMKRVTMELGGHAPAIVFDDADVKVAAAVLAAGKYRNAGQVCIAPTRFLVQAAVHDQFVEEFVEGTEALKMGNGLDEGVTIGPLANDRRRAALETLVDDAIRHGAKVVTGGKRSQNKGYFFEPTVLTDVTKEVRAMNEEPFGPLALVTRFQEFEEALAEANRLPYGLASYAYTRSVKNATAVAAAIESGMISINHYGLALPELPFGGVKESGYGSEGGPEAVEAYLVTKFVTQGSPAAS
ncbi:NAD-dependent succinate-semialdehyde dehydrogenase [Bradyrhizobium sp. KBS0727]|uniref:NAD-dependent succinate-semialdehyde dehydrogenase n=1 Tax=unclassified Bradyrhizobium TaxID=2631580 RepID=UPI00110EEF7C|nr:MULTISPECIES: NAD-dependent succinate-semialdehyde dehydrogenase [unclassified Bradyrhizobium]QDW40586.1 NAD-dependent succinate-semialdehyde dehydrogenase [Bradyrhizobium sp. KBS0725]QDW47191.1 NAD-dependent succinate-semialdehyde dehydrogenase [Bradyrhizobium sp. KBS0727]